MSVTRWIVPALITLLAACPKQAPEASMKLAYPPAPRGDVVDTYFGQAVADPFRPLEDPDAPATREWITAENTVTDAWIAAVPERAAIRARLEALWNFERYGLPWTEGDRVFYQRNDGLQNQSVLYVVDPGAEPRVLLDPNTLSADGTVSLSEVSVSEDGRLLAYGTSDGGSDWITLRVRDVATGKDLPDQIDWVKFSGATWTHDNGGFYYAKYPTPANPLEAVNKDQKVYYHKLGTPTSDDRLVYERPDQPEWGFGTTVTEDGKTLLISIWESTEPKNRVYVQDLTQPSAPVVPLLDGFDAYYNFVGNDGPVLYFTTDKDAPRGRVIAVDARDPSPSAWRSVVAETGDRLESASYVGGQLVLTYLHDARSVVRVHGTDGAVVREIALPGLGTVSGFGGKSTDTETFYSFTSYTTPTTIYRYDAKTGESAAYRTPKVDFDPSLYETEQVFYTSKDGTRVPMFVTYKKGLKREGTNPTLLYGYGGFDIALTPTFSVSRLVWLEMGGVYAVANLRGGGEYGRDWHEGGIQLKKQNVFDDFYGAAQHLIDAGYTAPTRLAAQGGSNGGLLVGAAITQRPDLFAAAVPQVGVLDMLRYHQFTIGWAWASDYGTSADNDEMFRYLLGYSPVHNLKAGTCYPATLVTTGDHDDRVVPAHSFKFAAALQEAQGCDRPTLIRIETRGGHGAGKPVSMVIDEAADIQAFLVRSLEMTPTLP